MYPHKNKVIAMKNLSLLMFSVALSLIWLDAGAQTSNLSPHEKELWQYTTKLKTSITIYVERERGVSLDETRREVKRAILATLPGWTPLKGYNNGLNDEENEVWISHPTKQVVAIVKMDRTRDAPLDVSISLQDCKNTSVSNPMYTGYYIKFNDQGTPIRSEATKSGTLSRTYRKDCDAALTSIQ